MHRLHKRASHGAPRGILFLLGLLFLVAIRPAHAYLDPGSGSYLFQVATAGLFGALYTLKVYWRQVRAFAGQVLRRRAPNT